MTDKQIIIDEQMENLNNLATQQLKRIEEEKRQIEHIAKTHLVETFDMQREIDKLKAENDELKKQHESDKGLITATGKMNYQLLQEYDKLKAENKRLEDLYDRVLQTLEDIEIITQQGIDFFYETERHADWKKVAIFMKQQLSFILGEIEEG